jgi:hypothetical protein
MARTKISTLKQLRSALRSLTLSEFMLLTRQGRAAYGALFDELEETFTDEDPASLPPPEEPRRLSAPPYHKLQPLPPDQPVAPWAAALSTMGIEIHSAEGALQGQRDLWAKGSALKTLREAGLAFEDQPSIPPPPGAGAGDLHVS